jgi:hypothetical protein
LLRVILPGGQVSIENGLEFFDFGPKSLAHLAAGFGRQVGEGRKRHALCCGWVLASRNGKASQEVLLLRGFGEFLDEHPLSVSFSSRPFSWLP